MSHQHSLSMNPTPGLVSVRVRTGDTWEDATIQALGASGLKLAMPTELCPQSRTVVLAIALRGFEGEFLRVSADVVSVRRSGGDATLVSVRYREMSARAGRKLIVTFLTRVAGLLELDEQAFSQTPTGWSYAFESGLFDGTRPIVNRRSVPVREVAGQDPDHLGSHELTAARPALRAGTVDLDRPAAWATEHQDGQAAVFASSEDGLLLRLRALNALPLSMATIWVSICPLKSDSAQMRLRGTVVQTTESDSTFTVRLVPVGLPGHLDRWKEDIREVGARRIALGRTLIEMPTQPTNR